MFGLSSVCEELNAGQWDATVYASGMPVAGAGPFPTRESAQAWAFEVMAELAPEPVPPGIEVET